MGGRGAEPFPEAMLHGSRHGETINARCGRCHGLETHSTSALSKALPFVFAYSGTSCRGAKRDSGTDAPWVEKLLDIAPEKMFDPVYMMLYNDCMFNTFIQESRPWKIQKTAL